MAETLFETDFSSGWPADWTVDGIKSAQEPPWPVWWWNISDARNDTGGTGKFIRATIAGSWQTTPPLQAFVYTHVLDLRGYSSINIAYDSRIGMDFNQMDDYQTLDVSTNGKAGPWINIWRNDARDFTAKHYSFSVPDAANSQNVVFRFQWYDGNDGGGHGAVDMAEWDIDNLVISSGEPDPPPVHASTTTYGSLAIGVPADTVDGKNVAGAVNVLHGSKNKLTKTGSQLLVSTPNIIEDNDRYGTAVAWGDFNNDGYMDLASGGPGEDIMAAGNDEGAVDIFHGSATGLSFHMAWTQTTMEKNDVGIDDEMGRVLCTGDFNNDGFADLAIGSPYEAIGPLERAGAVNILYGSATGLETKPFAYWYANNPLFDGGTSEAYDYFGASLASGDFNNDGYMDLAIGEPGGNVKVADDTAGLVHILYGAEHGLGENGAAITSWDQGSDGVPGGPEPLDYFGNSLTTGDFNKDGFADLAIGVSREDITVAGAEKIDAGAVNVLYGSAAGVTGIGSQIWYQGYGGIAGSSVTSDRFGHALAGGDFNQDGFDDLAISIPKKDIDGIDNAGAVYLLYGSNEKLTSTDSHLLHQGSPGMLGTPEAQDKFGNSLVSGNFNPDGYADLIIGVPYKNIDNVTNAGMVYALFGTADGLSTKGVQHWNQNSPDIDGVAEANDYFGWSLAATPFEIYEAPFHWPMFMPAIIGGQQ